MTKFLNRYFVFSLFLLVAFCVPFFGFKSGNNFSAVYADDPVNIYWGGTVTDSTADVGSQQNPATTFAEAKTALANSEGTIWVGAAIQVTEDETWSLQANQMVKRLAGFTGHMFTISGNATLTLQDIITDGNVDILSAGSIFKLTGSANLNINAGAQICNNNSTARGAGVILENSTASVNLSGGTISGNHTTQQGGAVYLSYGSSFVMNSGTVSDNQAKVGGAFFVENGANITILQGAITNNSVTGAGSVAGAIYSCADINIGNNPQISSNYAIGDENTESDIYIDFGKAIKLNTVLNNETVYNVVVFASSSSIPPRAVIVGAWGGLTDVSDCFENFIFDNSVYNFSIGEDDYAGKIMVNQYVILTFNACNGTSDFSEIVVASGVKYPFGAGFAVPQGYSFAGWSLTEGGIADYAPTDIYPVWDSQQFYAVYTRVVTYNANGGMGTLAGIRYYGLPYISEQGTELTKSGYTLAGWGASATTTEHGVGFYEKGSVIADSVLSTFNYTLYAVWKENSYTLSFDSRGGSPIDDVSVLYNAYVPYRGTTKLGYEFLGWFEKIDETTISNTAFDFTNARMGSNNLTLVAKWAPMFKNSDTYVAGVSYEIENVTQLKALSNAVNLGKNGYVDGLTLNYNELSYKLVGDIVFTASALTNFTPIGTSGHSFAGLFDGQLNKIYNVNIGNSLSYAGLFGVVSNATIKNVIVIAGSISGTSTAGGIVGQATNSRIQYCAFGGDIITTGSSGAVGGIVGNVLYDSIVESCVVNASIVSKSLAGGVAGKISNSMVNGCTAILSTVASEDKTGGLVGFVDSSGILCSSYFYGTVLTSTFYGSIAGYSLGTVENCYYITDTNNVGAINNTNVLDKALGLLSTQMFSLDDGVCGFGLNENFKNAQTINSEYVWQFRARQGNLAYLPIVDGFDGFLDEIFALSSNVVTFELTLESSTETWYQYVRQNGLAFEPFYKTNSTLSWVNGVDEWNFLLDKVTEDITLSATFNEGVSYFSGGTGTSADPFIIATYKNFVMFTNLINTASTYAFYADKYYVLSADIDCNNKTMIVIGDINHKFTGNFDGSGFTIKNYSLNANRNYVGVFGYNSGVIKNLNVKVKQLSGLDYVGSVCGYNSGTINNVVLQGLTSGVITIGGTNYVGGICGYNTGKILNCATSANVKATSNYAGGIVGYNKGQTSAIENCITNSNVLAENYVGGICGYAYSGNVLNTFFGGQLQGKHAGGIVGYMNASTVKYAVAHGYIFGTEYAGGLVGYGGVEADLEISYSLSEVMASEKLGGIAGTFLGVVSYCYYGKTEYDIGGVNGQSVEYSSIGIPQNLMLSINGQLSEYLDATFAEAMNEGVAVWYAKQNVDGEWFFPIQTALSNRISYTFSNATSVTLNYTENHISLDPKTFTVVLRNDFLTADILPYFASYMGITEPNNYAVRWYGESTFETEILKISTTNAQLYASWQIPFAGNGTEQSPYVIQSESDLCLLSALINNADTNPYYGSKHYALGANITLSTENFVPIGINNDLAFTGSFNGQGKIIYGVYMQMPTKTNVGLFGVLDGATVKNLKVYTGQITASQNVGGIAGLCVDSSIQNCQVNVTVSGSVGIVGGIVGKAVNSRIQLCVGFSSYVIAGNIAGGIVGLAEQNTSVEGCIANNVVYATSQVGGIVGCLNNSTISYVASLANVSGEEKVGGIVGFAYGTSTLMNNYFVNAVAGSNDVGGIAGKVMDCSLENCYFNIERCSSINALNGVYYSATEVKGVSSFFMATEMFWEDSQHWIHIMPTETNFYYPIVAGIANLNAWYDELVRVSFNVTNVLIDEVIEQYGYVLKGATYKFKVQINTDRSYNLDTFSITAKIGEETYHLIDDDDGIYSMAISTQTEVTVSVEPVKRTVYVATNSGGTSDVLGFNYIDDKDPFSIGFIASSGYYVSDVKVDGASVVGWTDVGYEIAEIDSNMRVDIVYAKLWVEKSYTQQDGKVYIESNKVYYDAEINTIQIAENDETMKKFKKKAKGNILCAYDFETNYPKEQVLSGDVMIQVFVGSIYNGQKMDMLLLDDGVVKTIQIRALNGYVTLNASKLRALAVVQPEANQGWLWLLALVIACILILVAIYALNSKRGSIKSDGKHTIMASSVDLNMVERRNEHCESKPEKVQNISIAAMADNKVPKKSKRPIYDEQQQKFQRELKKKEVANKLGSIRKNKE